VPEVGERLLLTTLSEAYRPGGAFPDPAVNLAGSMSSSAAPWTTFTQAGSAPPRAEANLP